MHPCVFQILREQGVAGLYRGTLVTLLRDAPGSAAYYGGYAVIKARHTAPRVHAWPHTHR